MRFGLKLNSAATYEPVPLDEAKLHLRLDSSADDLLIQSSLSAAREHCENYTGRCLSQKSYTLALDQFPEAWSYRYLRLQDEYAPAIYPSDTWSPLSPASTAIKLPWSPLQSVDSIVYVDASGQPQTLDPSQYIVDDFSLIPRITPGAGLSWPTANCQINAVKITFTAGYSTSAMVPATAKAAIKLMLSQLYENRQPVQAGQMTEMPLGVQSLLDGISVYR